MKRCGVHAPQLAARGSYQLGQHASLFGGVQDPPVDRTDLPRRTGRASRDSERSLLPIVAAAVYFEIRCRLITFLSQYQNYALCGALAIVFGVA